MAQSVSKLPVHRDESTTPAPSVWRPFEDLHREIDRLFDEVGTGGWLRTLRPFARGREPVFRREFNWRAPIVDIAESDSAYEIKAELPGIEARNVDVKLRNGNLVITGEKHDESEEKAKDYYLRERQFGSFERSFALPEGVDVDRIEARFANGVLTVMLPKNAEAKKPDKKITIKTA